MSVDLTKAQTGTMQLRVSASAEALVAAIEELGGSVSWQKPPKDLSAASAELEASVDQENAAEAMDAHWFAPDGDPENQCWPDAGDLTDFVAACASGDRRLAFALLPRITDAPAALFAAERQLLTGCRA